MDKVGLLKIFGLNLKLERIRAGLTQEKVAEDLDFSSVYVSNVESGKHNQVSLINAYKFANFYGKPLDYLLTEKS
ncbi:MAG: helix-turn-helix domain-containing protein [Muribaculaceae bacterium]|nr:helix-turn-helix domain-containing protein [Muribaculaceae bacterium]